MKTKNWFNSTLKHKRTGVQKDDSVQASSLRGYCTFHLDTSKIQEHWKKKFGSTERVA